MTKPALGVRQRQRERARRAAGIVVLPRERFGRLAIRRHAGGETEPHGGARRQPDPLAQADDRIEHDAGRARQRASVERRGVRRAAAAEEAGAIGLPFDGSLRPALEAQRMERPGRASPDRAAVDGRAARRCPADTRSRRTACRTPDARDR